jgi:hypothetical protein
MNYITCQFFYQLVTLMTRARRDQVFWSRSRHGHEDLIVVTVTAVTDRDRDRDRESRPFFLVCPNSLTLFLKRCTLWRMLDILILFVKSTTVCCGRKKENWTQLIFNKNIWVILSQQDNTDHFVTTRDQLSVTVTSRSRTFKKYQSRSRP